MFSHLTTIAAWLRAAADGREQVPAAAGGEEQEEQEERAEARWVEPGLARPGQARPELVMSCTNWTVLCRRPVLLRPAGPDTQLRQVQGPEGEGEGVQVRGGRGHEGHRGRGRPPPGLGRPAAGIHGQRWVSGRWAARSPRSSTDPNIFSVCSSERHQHDGPRQPPWPHLRGLRQAIRAEPHHPRARAAAPRR